MCSIVWGVIFFSPKNPDLQSSEKTGPPPSMRTPPGSRGAKSDVHACYSLYDVASEVLHKLCMFPQHTKTENVLRPLPVAPYRIESLAVPSE